MAGEFEEPSTSAFGRRRGGGSSLTWQAEISLDPLGVRKPLPIGKDGSYSALLTVPRTAKAGTYDLTVHCRMSQPSDAVVVHDAVTVTGSNK